MEEDEEQERLCGERGGGRGAAGEEECEKGVIG